MEEEEEDTSAHYWYVRSKSHTLARKSPWTYEDYLAVVAQDHPQDDPSRSLRSDLSFDPRDERQLSLDIPRAIVSIYRYILEPNDSSDEDMNNDESSSRDDDLDVSRAEPYFRILSRILSAYAVRNPRVGYIQGHADVVSFLLGWLGEGAAPDTSEHEIFWIYATVMERIFPVDFYSRTPRLQGLHVEMEVLARLITTACPRLLTVLSRDDVLNLASLLALRWFIPLFVGQLSFRESIRVWKRMLLGGQDAGSIFHLVLSLSIIRSVEPMIVSGAYLKDADESVDVSSAYTFLIAAAGRYSLCSLREDSDLILDSIECLRLSVRSEPPYVSEEIAAASDVTHFDLVQLAELQREFQILQCQEDPKSSRGLDVETVTTILLRVVPSWPPSAITSLLRGVVTPDALGLFDFQRLMVTLSRVCRGSVEEKLRLIYRVVDTTSRGYLDTPDVLTLAALLSRLYDASKIRGRDDEAPSPRRRASSGGALEPPMIMMGTKEREDSRSATFFLHLLLQMRMDGDYSTSRRLSFREWRVGARSARPILQCLDVDPEELEDHMTELKNHRTTTTKDDDQPPQRPSVALLLQAQSSSSSSLMIQNHHSTSSRRSSASSSTISQRRITLLSPTQHHQLASSSSPLPPRRNSRAELPRPPSEPPLDDLASRALVIRQDRHKNIKCVIS